MSEESISPYVRQLMKEDALRLEEIEGWRRDAFRYRWLREHSTQPVEPWSTHRNPESLDEAIDAALQSYMSNEEAR